MSNDDRYIFFNEAKSIRVYICTKCKMVVEWPNWIGKRKLMPYCEPCFYKIKGNKKREEEARNEIPLYEEKIDIRDILIDFLNVIQA